MNYLINSRLNLEKHYHTRTVQMLENIIKFETTNLQKLKELAMQSFKETVNDLNNNKEDT